MPYPAPLAACHGRRVILSTLARECRLSCQTVRRRLLALEQSGFLRLLRPLGEGGGKRPAPVLYLRGPLLPQQLPWELCYRTRLVEALAGLAEAGRPARVGCLPRAHGSVVDPVVELTGPDGPALVGFAFCADALVRRRRWSALSRAQRVGLLRQGFVLYPGSRAFFSSARVAVVPDAVFLSQYAQWMAAALDSSPGGLQRLMRACNARLTLHRPDG